MAQLVKYLLNKLDGTVQMSSTHVKSWAQWQMPITPGLERQDRKVSRSRRLV